MPKKSFPESHSEQSSSGTILRLSIDGRWTVTDMVESLSSFRDLYNLRLLLQGEYEALRDLERMYFDFPDISPFRHHIRRRVFAGLAGPLGYPASRLDTRNLDSLDSLIYPEERLSVQRVEYSSPGFKDLAGLGQVIGHIRGFIEKILDLYSNRHQRKLENEMGEIKCERMRIENAREFVSLARECGYTETQIRELIDWTDRKQQGLIRLVREEKIQDTKLLED